MKNHELDHGDLIYIHIAVFINALACIIFAPSAHYVLGIIVGSSVALLYLNLCLIRPYKTGCIAIGTRSLRKPKGKSAYVIFKDKSKPQRKISYTCASDTVSEAIEELKTIKGISEDFEIIETNPLAFYLYRLNLIRTAYFIHWVFSDEK